MNKKIIKSGILLGLFITIIYVVYKTQYTIPGDVENKSAIAYNLEPTSQYENRKSNTSNDDININNNKGFISEKINGITFNEQMNEIESYVKLLQDNYDYNELLTAAKQVELIDVHQYYKPYRDSVAQALEDKAAKIQADELKNDIVHWSNNKLVELYDTMEECFKNSGVEYTRSEDTHITYRYYYFTTN